MDVQISSSISSQYFLFIFGNDSLMVTVDRESRVPAGSGQFRLDLEDSETASTYTMPKLIEPDLHEILDEPVKLPVTR